MLWAQPRRQETEAVVSRGALPLWHTQTGWLLCCKRGAPKTKLEQKPFYFFRKKEVAKSAMATGKPSAVGSNPPVMKPNEVSIVMACDREGEELYILRVFRTLEAARAWVVNVIIPDHHKRTGEFLVERRSTLWEEEDDSHTWVQITCFDVY